MISFIAILFTTGTLLVCLATATCSYESPSGLIDLSTVPLASRQINQTYQGVNVSYWWSISLCKPVNSNCSDGLGHRGFVTQLNDGCVGLWTKQVKAWEYDKVKGVGAGVFVNEPSPINPKSELRVELICGPKLELIPVGTVSVSASLTFTMKLSTSAACASGPVPPYHPTPVPLNHRCDIHGTSVSSLATAVLPFAQTFQGNTAPYVWVINLCQAVRDRPSIHASGCSNVHPGYITQYTPGSPTSFSQCQEVWNVHLDGQLLIVP